ncbi:hypothetical protein ABVK25_011351 [Lepraria finkii]|uniref:Peptidase M20 dimerisation domain-containing protein n=1 Tax=Lepraria finkii TaxID=1340010 RepID=A0ABR4AQG7_9LECA
MRACGHDMHTASLMAAAMFLHAAKTTWKRTLVCVFQPDEETAGGAQAMVDDGLYYNQKRGIPILDVLHAQHDIALKAGAVASAKVPSSQRLTPSKSPSLAKWPYIVIASHIIVRLKTLIAKEVRPEEFAVIGCASIHGGSAPNIIPDCVDIKISIRTYRPEVHERVLTSVKRVVHVECFS